MLKSFVFETVSNPGTGTFTLLGAIAGRRAFSAAFSSGAKVLYTADDNAGASESGWGVWTSGANTLTRNVIENSLGTTAAINFTGATDVYCWPAAALSPIITDTGMLANGSGVRLVGRGASVARTTVQTLTTATDTAISWSGANYDDASIWAGANPTRMTVPAKVSRVRLTGCVEFNANATGFRRVQIRRNGGGVEYGMAAAQIPSPGAGAAIVLNVFSQAQTVTPGDYFEMFAYQTCGTNLNVQSSNFQTWMHMELLP